MIEKDLAQFRLVSLEDSKVDQLTLVQTRIDLPNVPSR
jgi:hypothetical protein